MLTHLYKKDYPSLLCVGLGNLATLQYAYDVIDCAPSALCALVCEARGVQLRRVT